MDSGAVKTLFVTLYRGLAGKPAHQKKVIEALGLSRVNQTVEKPNNAATRGMIEKVSQMLKVETDKAYRARKLQEYDLRKPQEPLVLKH